MRQRDFIFTNPRQVIGAIVQDFRGVKASLDGHFERLVYDRHVGKGTDPTGETLLMGDLYKQFVDILMDMRTDSPDKMWDVAKLAELRTNAAKARRWKARALGLNPDQANLDVALSGMTPWHDGERWLLMVAYPSPRPMAVKDMEVTDLVLIDPGSGAATHFGEAQPTLLCPVNDDDFTVHADARHWAREWATSRLEWFFSKRLARQRANVEPIWTGMPPSALAIGDVRQIQWPHAEQITAGVGIDPKALVAGVRRLFHLPRIHTPNRSAI
jgi:hypothetical protein